MLQLWKHEDYARMMGKERNEETTDIAVQSITYWNTQLFHHLLSVLLPPQDREMEDPVHPG